MTDKQIIINGVDVSKCKLYRDKVSFASGMTITDVCSIWIWQRDYSGLEPSCIMKCHCSNNSNCYYKQLERKEQECNKLYIQLKADEEYHKEEENTLRKIIKNKEERNIELYKENNKLKQTLAEINEIAKEQIPYFNTDKAKTMIEIEYDYTGKIYNLEQRMYKILQKISEVLNDRQK